MSNLTGYPTPTSPLYLIACKMVKAANEKDVATTESLLHPDFLQRMWPSSLRPPGTPEKGADATEFVKQWQTYGEMIESLVFNIDPPVNVVEAENCIVLQVNSNLKLKTGETFNNEYIFILRFKDELVVSFDEFLDSDAVMRAYGLKPKDGESA